MGDRGTSERTMVCFSFQVASPEKPIPNVNVVIGQSTSEDIMCDFGAPLRTFWKEDVSLFLVVSLLKLDQWIRIE